MSNLPIAFINNLALSPCLINSVQRKSPPIIELQTYCRWSSSICMQIPCVKGVTWTRPPKCNVNAKATESGRAYISGADERIKFTNSSTSTF